MYERFMVRQLEVGRLFVWFSKHFPDLDGKNLSQSYLQLWNYSAWPAREGHVQGQQYISVTHKSYPYRTWELRSAHGAVRCDAMRRANKDPNSKKVNKIISLLHQEFMQRCGRVQPYSHIHIQFIWNMEHGHALAFINILGCSFTAIYVLFPPSTISYLPLLLPVFFLCISCVLVC